ncbi:hypothetical protein H6775_02195 [Candidatus Nomurabacteria bacterium]|nr:hypothetical protein [Candidatus Nomurabacteria bacterium]
MKNFIALFIFVVLSVGPLSSSAQDVEYEKVLKKALEAKFEGWPEKNPVKEILEDVPQRTLGTWHTYVFGIENVGDIEDVFLFFSNMRPSETRGDQKKTNLFTIYTRVSVSPFGKPEDVWRAYGLKRMNGSPEEISPEDFNIQIAQWKDTSKWIFTIELKNELTYGHPWVEVRRKKP